MKELQPIWNIAEVLAQLGVKEVVLSPGSRCAPLVIAFNRHPAINCRTISDERSAAFIALGMAIKSKLPTVLVCTSGSALLNYYPAIAEAYYQKVPLIILSADRPPEWVDEGDGQTIRQFDVYKNHILKSYQLPVDLKHKDAHWEVYRKVSQAFNLSVNNKGPVHVNVPFREPFYPEAETEVVYDSEVLIQESICGSSMLSEVQIKAIQEQVSSYSKVLIVSGQKEPSANLDLLLGRQFCPVLADNLSNIKNVRSSIPFFDTILAKDSLSGLEPELVVVIGGAILSKRLKSFIRNSNAFVWSVSEADTEPDVFQKLQKHIRVDPVVFFDRIRVSCSESFFNAWQIKNDQYATGLDSFLTSCTFTELKAIHQFGLKVNENMNVHLSNSMSVRYLNLFPIDAANVLSNRGTSGIDGSTSTALGFTLLDDKTNILVTGDLSFFYDRNAFWNKYLPHNFKILLLNNHGGGIFNMIPGPRKQQEAKEFFITEQPLNARNTALDFDFEYQSVKSEKDYIEALHVFLSSPNRSILEVETSIDVNTEVFREFQTLICSL